MTWRAYADRTAPYAPGFFLALAVTLAGLRSPLMWLIFGVVFAAWFISTGRQLRLSGREGALLFFCWLGAAALFSPDPAFSISNLARYAVFSALFFSAARSEEDGWLYSALALGLAASAVFVFQKSLGLGATGFIGANPNYSAAFAAAAFPAALLLAFERAPGLGKTLLFAVAAALAAGLIASGSRGAMGAAFLSAAAGLGYTRRWGWLAALFAAVLALAAFLPPSSLEGLLKLSDPRAFARPLLWRAAFDAAAASPLLGWGPGLFERTFELFKFPYFDGVSFYGHTTLHAHSEPFNLAAEAGFPAALLLLAATACGIFRGGKTRLPLKLCALAVFLQGGVDMIFYSGAVSLLFWGSLGLLSAEEPGTVQGGRRAGKLLGAACAAGLLSGWWLSVSRGAEKDSAAAYPEVSLARAWQAALEKPKDPYPQAAAGNILYRGGALRGAEAAFDRALALEPLFAGARQARAQVYAAAGRRDAACADLALLKRPPAAAIRSAYQRGLVNFDREAAEKLEKEICRKMKTGAATALPRRTR